MYALHPPKEIPCHGGPAWPPYQHGTVSQVKLVFALTPTNGLVINQPTDHKTLEVERVVYTVICPPTDHHQSAFVAGCIMGQDSNPRLFASEEKLLAYQQTVMA